MRARVGAVSTQNITDPSIGPRTLDAMAAGKSAPEALASGLKASKFTEYRQVAVIDRAGRTATHSGTKTLGTNAVAEGRDCVAAGNLLATTTSRERWCVPSKPSSASSRGTATAVARRRRGRGRRNRSG
jgi:uncharacterized Ntn-hydrolase superfamily protein